MADDDSGVDLTNCRWPQLTYQKRQCARCGLTVDGLGSKCKVCLAYEMRKEMLVRQGAILAMEPDIELPLATDKGKARHIVLLGVPNMAFCGQEVTEAKKTRIYARLDKLPEGVCAACRGIADRAKKGGYKAP